MAILGLLKSAKLISRKIREAVKNSNQPAQVCTFCFVWLWIINQSTVFQSKKKSAYFFLKTLIFVNAVKKLVCKDRHQQLFNVHTKMIMLIRRKNFPVPKKNFPKRKKNLCAAIFMHSVEISYYFSISQILREISFGDS